MEGHERNNPKWKDECQVLRTVYWRDRCGLAEKLLKYVFTSKEIGRACHIHDLEEKIKRLQDEVTHQRKAAEYRNSQLKAANLIVSCSGGCEGGFMGDKGKVDEEMVSEVELIAKRLRSWFVNCQSRKE